MTGEPQPLPVPRRRPAAGTIVAILLIAAGVVSAFLIDHKRQTSLQYIQDPDAIGPAEAGPKTAADLPVIGTVADFALTERSGQKVTLASLRGRVWVAEYFFTYCGAVCPAMNRNFGQLHREFTGKEEPKFVSISVDPARDTLDVLAEHARTQQADTDRWWFLTGDEKVVADLAASMKLHHKMGDPTSHSSRFFLIDREGQIRGTYIGTMESELVPLRRDLKLLLEAPKN